MVLRLGIIGLILLCVLLCFLLSSVHTNSNGGFSGTFRVSVCASQQKVRQLRFYGTLDIPITMYRHKSVNIRYRGAGRQPLPTTIPWTVAFGRNIKKWYPRWSITTGRLCKYCLGLIRSSSTYVFQLQEADILGTWISFLGD